MKFRTSHKLVLVSLATIAVSFFSALIVNILTNDQDITYWLKSSGIGSTQLMVGVLILGSALIFLSYFQIKYSKNDEPVVHNLDLDINRFVSSLKQRYQTRYRYKLDKRLEITLKVTDNQTRSISEEFVQNATKGEAIKIIQRAFERRGRLLIIGNPGSGKTVLLLKLALDLLSEIKNIGNEPFPIIFGLASWSDQYERFEDWIQAVLVSGHGLSEGFAKVLMEQDRIIFLLDGLDELASDKPEKIAVKHRAKFLNSLNSYLSRGRKVVITSRAEEFTRIGALTDQVAPVSVIVRVLGLSKTQILSSLKLVKEKENLIHFASANNLLQLIKEKNGDKILEVLRTPFYFTLAMEIFDTQILRESDFNKTAEEFEDYLTEQFVEMRLARTFGTSNHRIHIAKLWLKWLGNLLVKKNNIKFELSDLQPNDLIEIWYYRLITGVFTGLFGYLFGGIVFGLFGTLIGGLVGSLDDIKTEDIRTFKPSKIALLNTWKKSIIFGIVFGVTLGLIEGPIVGLIFGLFICLLITLQGAISVRSFAYIATPYQRFVQGIMSGMFKFSIVIGILAAIVIQFGSHGSFRNQNFYPTILYFALFGGLFGFLVTPLFRHFILRLCFYIEGTMPIAYANFLNYATEARILERDGGFWRFRHRNLQEYFVSIEN